MGRWDLWETYVRSRLDRWGDEFALHRDCDYLGHQSKNLLQVLKEHKGKPPRVTGFKPMEIDLMALQVEEAITDLARANVAAACVMRAMYCGSGRRGVERLETARVLVAKMAGLPRLSRTQYYALHEDGVAFVKEWLEAVAKAA